MPLMPVPLSQRAVLVDRLSGNSLKLITGAFLTLFLAGICTTAFAWFEDVYSSSKIMHEVRCNNPCINGGCPAGMLTKLRINKPVDCGSLYSCVICVRQT